MRRSLRFRITLALLLFVGVSSGAFALAIFHVNDKLENQLLDETLEHEFQEFQQRYRQNRSLPLPYSTQIRSYLVDAESPQSLPPALWQLSPGMHHDVGMDGRVYHVLNRAMGNKRVYIALDISRIERRETRLVLFLAFGVVLVSGLAVWAGYLMSRHLIAPVTDLAGRVSELNPGEHSVSLAREFAQSEVEPIAQAFDRFLARLDQFMEREHAFTEDASHELRTPLAVINSASELLLADSHQPEALRQPLLRIQRASRQMKRLTNALLFLAREAGTRAEHAEGCQAHSVIAETVDSYRSLHSGKPVEIVLGTLEPTVLAVPPEFLEIVLANLLQNALTHTREGQVRVALQGGVMTVDDTGSGIQPEDLPRIFGRDYRGAGSRGIGRGLDLVKRICDRHGWRIEVSSQPGRGTRFTVHLGESGLSS